MLHGQGHAGVHMMINQKVALYKQSLTQWVRSVEIARSDHDAFRIAANKPHPSSLIRSLSSLYSSNAMQAKNSVERNLMRRVEKMGGNDPTILNLMRMSQGHWPRVYRKIEELRREAAEESNKSGSQSD
jgi:hypothetical protein